MDENTLKANIAKVLQFLGIAGGTVGMMTSGHISLASWQGMVGALSTLVSFGFMIFDTFFVKAKIQQALAVTPGAPVPANLK